MKISIIAAIGKNRELGKDNKLLWYIPEDLKRFKKLTTGHVVIMGRKTFESLEKPLSNRINIIITHQKNYYPFENKKNQNYKVIISHSLNEAIKAAKKYEKPDGEIFIIGGGTIYQQAISLADKLYLTIVEGKFKADTFFPDYSLFKKKIFEKKRKDKNYCYTFLELEK